jgi:hypothetical protein
VGNLLDLIRKSPLRAISLLLSFVIVGVGVYLVASGEVFGGVWLLVIGLAAAPLNAYRLGHPLKQRVRERRGG